jgi:hypothetical protein
LCEKQKELLQKFDDLCREHGHHKEQEGFFSRLFNEVLGKKSKEKEEE